MTEPFYYAKGMEVWKSPVSTKIEGGQSISLGFHVCTASEVVGEEGATAIAALLCLGEEAQAAPKANVTGVDIPRLPIGTHVEKVGGYPFPGTVVAAFHTLSGQERFVIEATGEQYAGMLHIFNGGQLRAATTEGSMTDTPKDNLKVKPLKWREDRTAIALGAKWMVWPYPDPLNDGLGNWLWQVVDAYPHASGRYHTEAEAKAAAQADYEVRILSCLVTTEGQP